MILLKEYDYHKNTEDIQLHLIQKYYAKLPKEDLKTLLSLYEKIYQIAKEAP
nr:hypothetical protein P5627_00180 [Bacillus safensis]